MLWDAHLYDSKGITYDEKNKTFSIGNDKSGKPALETEYRDMLQGYKAFSPGMKKVFYDAFGIVPNLNSKEMQQRLAEVYRSKAGAGIDSSKPEELRGAVNWYIDYFTTIGMNWNK